ncbi:MAG: DNA translocase FtsK 4TM domain-containing protein, partial [Candidatus Omnitrophica bacterium]|nr:DNA translocase FtsK 4TM domain-containing protein [Candidatus Omnitrophota bacterium]
MKEERINEIWAIFLLAVTILLFVSLFSFDPTDLSFYTSNPNVPVKNFTGMAGAYLAGVLMFTIGRASFVIPFITLSWAVGRFIGRIPEKSYLKALGAVVLTIATSSF